NISLQVRRPNQSFGPITWYDPAGFSSYNALQVKFERRFSKGLQFLNAFTWGKAIDNGTQALDGNNGNQASPQDVRNLRAEWRGGEAFRPNVTGPVRADDSVRSVDNYFNKDNVALPTDPSRPFGTAGRDIVRATPLHQLDLGLFKNFRLPKESMKLQFRSE